MRGAALIHGRKWFLIQDEVTTAAPAQAWWFLHTKAAIALSADRASATLTLGGKRCIARILSPAGAGFAVMDPKPLPTSPNPAGQNANAGWKKLAIHLTGVKDLRLTVVLAPLADGENPPAAWPMVYPLDKNWPTGPTAIPPGKARQRSAKSPWRMERGRLRPQGPDGKGKELELDGSIRAARPVSVSAGRP
jgi:hypothetical protein